MTLHSYSKRLLAKEQLIGAVQSVTNKTSRSRRQYLLARLHQAIERSRDKELIVYAYYVSLGTVPQSLWDNG